MKAGKRSFSFFIGGFILMALAHTAIHCEDYTGYGEDYGNVTSFDDQAVLKAGDLIESAFASGQPAKVREQLSITAQDVYGDLLNQMGEQNLKAYAEAFRLRTLGALSEKYAEFAFTVNGVGYTLAVTLDANGTWKIMRF